MTFPRIKFHVLQISAKSKLDNDMIIGHVMRRNWLAKDSLHCADLLPKKWFWLKLYDIIFIYTFSGEKVFSLLFKFAIKKDDVNDLRYVLLRNVCAYENVVSSTSSIPWMPCAVRIKNEKNCRSENKVFVQLYFNQSAVDAAIKFIDFPFAENQYFDKCLLRR